MVRSLDQFTRQHDCIKFSANNISKARMNRQVFVGIMTHEAGQLYKCTEEQHLARQDECASSC